MQDMLHAMGPQAGHVVDLWRYALLLCSGVFGLVLLVFLIAVWRRRGGMLEAPADMSMTGDPERPLARKVAWATGASVLLLFTFIVASVATDRAIAHLALRDAVHIRLTGHQWWWQARYDDAQPAKVFDTANELHVPVGRPVILTLTADDVIHSFWVPNLAGKKDLIPGRTATLPLRADKAGTYRGQCAEFCGLQHAWMALTVVAEPPEAYEAWLAQQRQSAPPPTDPLLQRGQAVFMGSSCVMCHAVQGTDARGQRAPDLTHIGSRQTLASGRLPNTPQHLASWITDPQAHKPGSNMPGQAYAQEDLQALVAWLESLK